jgi:acyl carrier protein
MDIRSQLLEFFSENFLLDLDGELSDQDSFLENGIVDSTGVLELIGFIEKTFDIRIEDEEIVPDNLDSIENIKRFLEKKSVLVEAKG